MIERAWMVAALSLAGCVVDAPPRCMEGSVRCEGTVEVRCVAGVEEETPCAMACNDTLGCSACAIGASRCEGEDVQTCGADGTWALSDRCTPLEGEICRFGACARPCEDAARSHAYLGCEYWPVVTPNPALGGTGNFDAFDFAIVTSNPNPWEVLVTVEGPSGRNDRRLAPHEVAAIPLPWVEPLAHGGSEGAYRSSLVAGGAYHVTSTSPIAAYVFNPLQYGTPDCTPFTDPPCSFSNDASLLLPTTALGDRYLLVAPTTQSTLEGVGNVSGSPAYVVIVGTADDTQVALRSSAFLLAGDTAARAPNETLELTLDAGDAALVFVDMMNAHWSDLSRCTGGGAFEQCEASADFDLTGSVLEASHPVAVYTGAPCHDVPYDVSACDTLIEQALPLSAWGSSAVAVPLNLAAEDGNLFRVVSGADGNAIHFEPASAHADVTLDQGEWVDLLIGTPFLVQGTDRLAVAQYLVGQDFGGPGGSGSGDPSFAFVTPREQYRQSYDLLAPDTYDRTWLLVTAPPSTPVRIDGALASLTRALPGVDAAWIEIAPGAHHIDADAPIGVLLGGVAPYTSYLMAGGLDVAPIVF